MQMAVCGTTSTHCWLGAGFNRLAVRLDWPSAWSCGRVSNAPCLPCIWSSCHWYRYSLGASAGQRMGAASEQGLGGAAAVEFGLVCLEFFAFGGFLQVVFEAEQEVYWP